MEKSPINSNLLVVRPIHLDEVLRWRAVMAAEHYMGFGKAAGVLADSIQLSLTTGRDWEIDAAIIGRPISRMSCYASGQNHSVA